MEMAMAMAMAMGMAKVSTPPTAYRRTAYRITGCRPPRLQGPHL